MILKDQNTMDNRDWGSHAQGVYLTHYTSHIGTDEYLENQVNEINLKFSMFLKMN